MPTLEPPPDGVNTPRPSPCPKCGEVVDQPGNHSESLGVNMATYLDRAGHWWTVTWRNGDH